ncbi:MAG TPA: hypothetical protein PKK06_00365 [Phycisphaerae bacterium]|nr:hypothetical protein [Phycisphaerae bacterium]HNU43938.1 hypothetical protein [Phycisphaerae bacterium]
MRRHLLSGLLRGVAGWAGLTILLYLPALGNLDTEHLGGLRGVTDAHFAARFGSFPGLLRQTCAEWTRHTHWLLDISLATGGAAFAVFALRRRDAADVLALSVLAVGPLVSMVSGILVPPRVWLFALPLVYVCAVWGLLRVGMLVRRLHWAVGVRLALASVAAAGAALSLRVVHAQQYLCSEPEALLAIEEVIDEWAAAGTGHSALVTRYTPASAYYRLRKGLPESPPPHAPETERVFIAAFGRYPLERLWHAGVPGYERFGPPRLWRVFPDSALYLAERQGEGG